MSVDWNDFIIVNGHRKYKVICEEILPENHININRRGQVCGNVRYVIHSAAKKGSMCFNCSQRRKGKMGYQKAMETVTAMGYQTLPQHYLEHHPSRAESAFFRALDLKGIVYEKNKKAECNRNWLMDAFVNPNLCIELDDIWIHEKSVEQDAEKDAYLESMGIQVLRLKIDSKKNIQRQIDSLMPKVLKFLGATSHE